MKQSEKYGFPIYEDEDNVELDKYTEELTEKLEDLEDTDREEINNIYKDVQASKIHYETEQAKSLYIDDATDSRGKIDVFGNVEQETREGYNMYDYSKDVMPSGNGLTIDFDEKTAYLIISGTPSSNYQYITKRQDITNKLENGETYTLYAENITTGVYVQITKSKDGSSEYIVPKNNTITFVADTSYKYELDIQTSTVASTGQLNNYKTRYMLYKGTETKDWQLAGAMPSLDYPSKVECLGSNVNLVTEILDNLWYNADTNKFMTMQNTVSAIAEIPQNTVITIKKKNGGNRFAVVTSNIKPTTGIDNSTIFIDNENSNRKTYAFKNTDKKWVWVGVQNGGTEEDKQKAIEEIKIEEGETATSYSPMGQGSTKIKKTNRNYLDSFNYYTANTSKTINGITFKINPDGTITANGTATANAFFDFSYTHVIGTNKKMIINNIGGTATGTVRFTAYNKDFSTTTSVLRETTGTQEMNLSDNIEYSIFRYAVYQNAVCNNLTLGFMVLDKTETDRTYTQHQEENYILNIQQEMLSGDYIDLDRKKEVHGWNKYIFTGNETFTSATSGGTQIYRTTMFSTELKKDDENVIVLCNNAKGVTNKTWTSNADKDIVFGGTNGLIQFIVKEVATLEEFKAKLQELYNSGIPVEIYYKTAEVTELDLTEAQIKTLEQLNKLRFYKNVNNIFTLEDIALLQGDYEVDLQKLKGIPGPKRRQRRYRCEGRYRRNWSKRR